MTKVHASGGRPCAPAGSVRCGVPAPLVPVDGGSRPRGVSYQDEHRRCGDPAKAPLSIDSAASVREAAMAIMHHGIRYLPVVEDGTLVGIVAITGAGQPERSRRKRQP
jgi:CBS domain-containing protein